MNRMMLGAYAWESHYPCFTHSLYCSEKEELKNASVSISFVNIRRYLHGDTAAGAVGLTDSFIPMDIPEKIYSN